MISVGQQLSLMCIGQDLRGNIKLSLKATLPQKTKKPDPVKTSSTPVEEDPPRQQEPQNSTSYSATSPIVIRSAVECDEEEKLSTLASSVKHNSKSPRVLKTKSSSQKPKSLKSLSNEDELGCDLGSKKTKGVKPFLLTEKRTNSGSNYTSSEEEEEEDDDKHKHMFANVVDISDFFKDRESKVEETSIDAKKLKLGTKVTAKIVQVRARGLVLDLGGGINGMYRFEVFVIIIIY